MSHPLLSGAVPLLLAPMAGVTDLPYRRLCREFGATATITEMVSAKALTYGDKKSLALCGIDPNERPCAIQLFGHEPQVLAEAAALVAPLTPEGLDINMGCPVPKIVVGGDGSALMRSPELIGDIVAAVCRATALPVSVKLRAGIDGHKNAVECALAAQQGGAALVTVHGRMREQFYMPSADWDVIAEVRAALRIPVLANGDIDSPQAAKAALAHTGADGLMIGRAARGNPFLFGEIAYYLQTGTLPDPPPLELRLSTARRHIHELVAHKGSRIGMLEARGHLGWYFRGLRGAAALRERCNRLTALHQLDEILALAEELQGGDPRERQPD